MKEKWNYSKFSLYIWSLIWFFFYFMKRILSLAEATKWKRKKNSFLKIVLNLNEKKRQVWFETCECSAIECFLWNTVLIRLILNFWFFSFHSILLYRESNTFIRRQRQRKVEREGKKITSFDVRNERFYCCLNLFLTYH